MTRDRLSPEALAERELLRGRILVFRLYDQCGRVIGGETHYLTTGILPMPPSVDNNWTAHLHRTARLVDHSDGPLVTGLG